MRHEVWERGEDVGGEGKFRPTPQPGRSVFRKNSRDLRHLRTLTGLA